MKIQEVPSCRSDYYLLIPKFFLYHKTEKYLKEYMNHERIIEINYNLPSFNHESVKDLYQKRLMRIWRLRTSIGTTEKLYQKKSLGNMKHPNQHNLIGRIRKLEIL